MPKALSEQHQPVMVAEVFELLKPALLSDDALLIDCTLGLGGHSEYFLERLSNLSLIGFDQDQIALDRAKERLKEFSNRVIFVKANFKDLKQQLLQLNTHSVNAIIFDLGISSIQIDERNRGFSYLSEDELDMRMDLSSNFTAKELVNTWDENQI